MTVLARTERYSAYATAHGRTADDQLAYDRAHHRGGHMGPFTIWLAAQWEAFGIPMQSRYATDAEQAAFTAWLTESSMTCVTDILTLAPMRAARCSCGAVVFHESPSVVDGFIADHQPGRRHRCTRIVEGVDIDDVARAMTLVECDGQGVLFAGMPA